MAPDELLHRYLIFKYESPCAEQFVGHAIQLWESLAAELIPVIGEEGFAALYARSLHLTQSSFPWLAGGEIQQHKDSPFSALRTSLEECTFAEADNAGKHLFTTFTDILVQLIGESLTFSILRAAWGDDASGTTNEE